MKKSSFVKVLAGIIMAFLVTGCAIGVNDPMVQQNGQFGSQSADLAEQCFVQNGYYPDVVYAQGTKFKLNGEDFYFQGNNTYSAGLGYDSKTLIDQMMAKNQEKGVKVLRIWGFNEGFFQDAQGNLIDSSVKSLDYTIKSAWDHGIRVIVVFANFWGDFGGTQWYVNQHGGGENSRFFTEPAIKEHYKKYISQLVTRVNREYNPPVSYKDDPAIFAWELMNEPRGTTLKDPEGQTVSFAASAKIMTAWIKEMSDYIYNSLDKKHMISIGDEGFNNKAGNPAINGMWPDNGAIGMDYEANIALPHVSYGSVHLYPDNWGGSLDIAAYGKASIEDWCDWYISNRAAICKKVNKPVILGEYGRKKENFVGTIGRNDIYRRWNKVAAVDNNYAGMLVWQLEVQGMRAGDGVGYRIDLDGTNDLETLSIIEDNANYMNAKSGRIAVSPTISPVRIVFDKNPSEQKDIAVTLNLNGHTLKSIKSDFTALMKGTEYTVSGGIVTISKSYLAKQPAGSVNLRFAFTSGYESLLSIAVIQTPEIGVAFSDDFNDWTATGFTVVDGNWVAARGNLDFIGRDGGKVLIDQMKLSDLSFEADVQGDNFGTAGLFFRATEVKAGKNNFKGYYLGVDSRNDRVVFAKRDGVWTELATASARIKTNKPLHVKVIAKGANFKVYLDNMAAPAIDIIDFSFLTGVLGLRSSSFSAGFDNVLVTADSIGGVAVEQIAEAEDGILNNLLVSTKIEGYSGTGYVGEFGGTGDSVTTIINSPVDGIYNVNVKFATPYGGKFNSLFVNGALIARKAFKQTATFTDAWFKDVALKAGNNKVTVMNAPGDWGWFVVDYILATTNAIPKPVITNTGPKYLAEAEEGELTGVSESSDIAGFSGTGYVGDFKNGGDSAVMVVNVPEAGDYEILVHYAAPYDTKYNSVFLNGAKLGQYAFVSSAGFTDLNAGATRLNQGDNTITVKNDSGDWGYIFVDYVKINKVTVNPVKVINTFETGTEGWAPASWQNPAPGVVSQSADFATEGTYSAKVDSTGEGWYIVEPFPALDFSTKTYLRFDIYSPISTSVSISFASGSTWGWHQTGNYSVNPGWNTVTVNLSADLTDGGALADANDVHRIGVYFKTGVFYLDNVRVQ